MGHEFYLNDGSEKPGLVGILREERKARRPVTRKPITRWGKLAAGSYVNPNSIYLSK